MLPYSRRCPTILNNIRYQHLPGLQQEAERRRARLARFIRFVERANSDQETAQELLAYLEDAGAVSESDVTIKVLEDVDRSVTGVFHQLEEYNLEDFEALQALGKATDSFPERDELEPLFGRYSLEIEQRLPHGKREITYVETRQMYWRRVSLTDRNAERRDVAERASERYGLILAELAPG